MADVRRQLIKAHLTTALPPDVTPAQKLAEKARGWIATDQNTPVLGELAAKILELVEPAPDKEKIRGVASYWSDFDSVLQFPNDNAGSWMEDELAFNFESLDIGTFRAWLAGVKSPADLLVAPIVSNEEQPDCKNPPAPVVFADDLSVPKASCRPPQPRQGPSALSKPESKDDAKEPCKFFAQGRCSFGDKCKMLHVGDVEQRQARCHAYSVGKCTYGDKCKYRHEAASAGGPCPSPTFS
jgi:hypothetical protein